MNAENNTSKTYIYFKNVAEKDEEFTNRLFNELARMNDILEQSNIELPPDPKP